MKKLIIEIPLTVWHRCNFQIKEEDINESDHMGNERILHHANLVRYNFFESLNLLPPDEEHGFIIVNHSIVYKSEGFLGDTVVCEAGVTNPTECSFDLIFHFIKSSAQKTLAVVRSGLVYFDYQNRKIRHLPDKYLSLFPTP